MKISHDQGLECSDKLTLLVAAASQLGAMDLARTWARCHGRAARSGVVVDPNSSILPRIKNAFKFIATPIFGWFCVDPSSLVLSLRERTYNRSKPWGRFTDRWRVPVR